MGIYFLTNTVVKGLRKNGSGKSTMLKLMAGLVKPDNDEVTVEGEKVNRMIASKIQTVIITTHEIDDIEKILDEVLLIQNGQIIAKEEVEGIRERNGESVVGWMKAHYR